MQIRLMQPGEEDLFNAHVPHILQTTYWGDFLTSLGREVSYIIVEDGETIHSFLVSYNRIPHTPYFIAYLQKSWMPTEKLVSFLMQNRKDVAYIKCEAQQEASDQASHQLQETGFIRSNWNIFLPHTFIVDLTQSTESLFHNFNQNTKRNIRRAQKAGITVVERKDADAIEAFMHLHHETLKRQVYFTHDDTYYRKMWQSMQASGRALLLLAQKGEETIAAIVLFSHKGMLYYPYGASLRDEAGSSAMALLHYEAMLRAKGQLPFDLHAERLVAYDLWGSLGEDAPTADPMFGVHRFKRGFGGHLVEYVGSYDYVIKPHIYYPFRVASGLRKHYFTLQKKRKHHAV